MARIRTVKPEFFTSEDIVSLSPLARLLYIAIWCEADKEGRLVWKPVTFKLRYLPGDNCDVHALCAELVSRGLVVLYGDGLAYIPAFGTHQHINPREAESRLPCPSEIDASSRVAHASSRVADAQVGREGKGKEGNTEPNGSDSSGALKAKAVPPANPGKPKPAAFTPPDWVPADDWTEFVRMRRAMRNVPFTDAAARGVVAELEKLQRQGYPPDELLQSAVTNGWRTVYPPKGNTRSPPAAKHAAAARAIYGAPSNPEFIDVETVVRQH